MREATPSACADGVEQVEGVAVDVADHRVGLAARELGERGRLAVGGDDVVAVGDQVVGEERAGGGVLLAEQDRVGGLHEPSFHLKVVEWCLPGTGRVCAVRPVWRRVVRAARALPSERERGTGPVGGGSCRLA